MEKILIIIRDKAWFYTNQLYPNDTDEDNFKDFKLRFSLFFLPPVILLIGFCGWFFSIVLNSPKNISVYDYQVIIPLSLLPINHPFFVDQINNLYLETIFVKNSLLF